MWRSLFLAIGISLCILGVESLAIDKAVLHATQASASAMGAFSSGAAREITPPEWAPWTLMSAGVVVLLYSFTIPRRVRQP
jgi:hypothetical protein